VTDILDDLRSVRDVREFGSAEYSIFDRAVREIERVRKQNDEFQARGTELVMANRDLRAQLAGHPMVRVRRVGSHDLPLPAYATDGAAGLDLRADLSMLDQDCLLGDRLLILAGHRVAVPCGFAFEIPDGWEGHIRGRSGWMKRGLYAEGTIDADFRGCPFALLENRGHQGISIEHGERVAQMIICPAPQVRLEEATELSPTERGTNGAGSTGVR
jgi:dUTP pyrophosphatase